MKRAHFTRALVVLAAVTVIPACGGGGGGGGGPAGPPFTGFDGAGNIVVNPDPGQYDEFEDAAVDVTNGHMIVAGIAGNGTTTNMKWRIEKRMLSDGSLVAGFGTDGVLEIDPNPAATGLESAVAVAVDPASDALYIAGWEYLGGSDTDWRIEKRLLSTGAPDPVFGGGTGHVNAGFTTGDNRPGAMAIDATHMYVAGHQVVTGQTWWRIEKRALVDGALDVGTFGAPGFVLANPSAGDDEAREIVIDTAGGFMIVAGTADVASGDSRWHYQMRSLADGSATGFGAVTLNPGAGDDDLRGIVLDAAGGVFYLFGDDTSNGGFDVQWRIEKRDLTTNSLVAAFDDGSSIPGRVIANLSAGFDLCFGGFLDGASLYVCGLSHDLSGSGLNFRIEIQRRSATTAALDATFGTSGTLTEDPTALADGVAVFAADATHLYLAGVQNIDLASGGTDVAWRIEKRAK